MEEDFNLTWSSYSDHIAEMLQNFHFSNLFADVTMVCDDKVRLEAHRLVLSMCSNVFKEMLSPPVDGKTIIYLQGINSQEMNSILQFMYIGEASFPQSRTVEFIRVATKLELKGLCNNKVEKSFENFADQSLESLDIDEKDPDIEFEYQLEYSRNSNINKKASVTKANMNSKTIHKTVGTTMKSDSKKLYDIKEKYESKTQDDGNIYFVCKECEYKNVNKQNTERHIKANHLQLEFNCDQCTYATARRASLLVHIRTVHEKIYKYQCQQYEKPFLHALSLKTHVLSEHEKHKFSCSHCRTDFNRKCNLIKHTKKFHS